MLVTYWNIEPSNANKLVISQIPHPTTASSWTFSALPSMPTHVGAPAMSYHDGFLCALISTQEELFYVYSTITSALDLGKLHSSAWNGQTISVTQAGFPSIVADDDDIYVSYYDWIHDSYCVATNKRDRLEKGENWIITEMYKSNADPDDYIGRYSSLAVYENYLFALYPIWKDGVALNLSIYRINDNGVLTHIRDDIIARDIKRNTRLVVNDHHIGLGVVTRDSLKLMYLHGTLENVPELISWRQTCIDSNLGPDVYCDLSLIGKAPVLVYNNKNGKAIFCFAQRMYPSEKVHWQKETICGGLEWRDFVHPTIISIDEKPVVFFHEMDSPGGLKVAIKK
jgi:hypothetical protein